MSFLLLATIVLLQAGLVVGIGLLRVGRVSLRGLGWRWDAWPYDVLRGVVGFAAIAGIVLALKAAHGG